MEQDNENIDIVFITEALKSLSNEQRMIAQKILSTLVQMLETL